jgi:asparagine synthetase B (glutamine-hydrolysing)
MKGLNTARVHNEKFTITKKVRDGILTVMASDSEVIVHLYEEFAYDFVISWTGI